MFTSNRIRWIQYSRSHGLFCKYSHTVEPFGDSRLDQVSDTFCYEKQPSLKLQWRLFCLPIPCFLFHSLKLQVDRPLTRFKHRDPHYYRTNVRFFGFLSSTKHDDPTRKMEHRTPTNTWPKIVTNLFENATDNFCTSNVVIFTHRGRIIISKLNWQISLFSVSVFSNVHKLTCSH